MVFSVALELKADDFRRVAETPRAVICGLISQFILLPVGTWLAMLALFATPFNFGLMVATNPATASWLRELNLDVSGLWISLMLLLAIPMSAGLWIAYQFPKLTAKI